MHGPATLSADSVVVRAGGGVDRLSLDVEIDPVAAGPKLLESDEKYSRSVAEKGFADAMVDWVHRSARFYRNGHLPLVGWEVITTTASVTNAVWTDWEIRAAIVSNSGDLGCTYGVVRAQSESDGGSPQLHASYYRIWKQDADSSWRVVVDVLIPIVTSRE